MPAEPLRRAVAAAALEIAERSGVSSVHWLFTGEADTQALESSGFLIRTGCQFHWPNAGFRDFQDYLESLRSKNSFLPSSIFSSVRGLPGSSGRP